VQVDKNKSRQAKSNDEREERLGRKIAFHSGGFKTQANVTGFLSRAHISRPKICLHRQTAGWKGCNLAKIYFLAIKKPNQYCTGRASYRQTKNQSVRISL